MPNHLVIRVAGLLATAAVAFALDSHRSVFQWLTYSMGFVHYVLALRYSTRQLAQATTSLSHGLALLALIFLAASLYIGNASLVVYFGIHHAFNEAYRHARDDDRAPRAPALFLQAAAFAFALQGDGSLVGTNPTVVAAVFASAIAVYAVWIMRNVGLATLPRLARICAPELAAILLALASLVVRIEFLHVVLYHFAVWSILPVQHIRSRGRYSLTGYVTASVLMTVGFLALSPIGPEAIRINPVRFTNLFLLGSYAHITLSFALSDAHPDWMIRIFRAGPGRGPANASMP